MKINDLSIHLLLLLRNTTTATGYELSLAMAKSYVRRAGHQQVYRELNKLCKRGFVKFVTIEQSGKPDSKPYSITSAGLDAIEAAAINIAPKIKPYHSINTIMIATKNVKYFQLLSVQLTTEIENIKAKMTSEESAIERLAMSRELSIHTAEVSYCSDVLKWLRTRQSQAA